MAKNPYEFPLKNYSGKKIEIIVYKTLKLSSNRQVSRYSSLIFHGVKLGSNPKF